MYHILMENRVGKKKIEEREREINVHEMTIAVIIYIGQIFASRAVRNNSTASRRKSGRDEARRISCSMHTTCYRSQAWSHKSHLHRYNVYNSTFHDLRAHMYTHVSNSQMYICGKDLKVVCICCMNNGTYEIRTCIVRDRANFSYLFKCSCYSLH